MPQQTTLTLLTRSEAETVLAARDLVGRLAPGTLLILTGPLGAGKTAFVRGLAEGMGIDARQVHSPSFTIVTEYGPAPSGRRLVHVDLYRVDREAEIAELGLAEGLQGDRVMAVEWGEKLPRGLRAGATIVELQDAGGEMRCITITTPA